MRILLAHNYYRERGGEDAMVESDLRQLNANGHVAELWSRSSLDLTTFTSKAQAIFHLSYSKKSREDFTAKIRSFQPDIVHVHNFFPMLTPSIYDACADQHVPVVQTLHNYRTTCANALLLRDSKPCTLCVEGSTYQAVKYGCYRGSRLASLPMAHMIAHHKKQKTWSQKTQRILVPTEFSKRLHVAAGIKESHISVRVNSIANDPGFTGSEKRAKHGLYVGRLSAEKGITTLSEASQKIQALEPIQVIGYGEEEKLLRRNRSFEMRGFIPTTEVNAAMKRAGFLIFPTLCFEGAFPLVLVEAIANGLPIIASKIGAIPEFLTDGEDALLFTPGDADELANVINKISTDKNLRNQLAIKARKKFESLLNPEASISQLMLIYQSVIHV